MLQTFPMCRYVSVVGQLVPVEVPPHEQSSLSTVLRAIAKLLRTELAPRICGVETSNWAVLGGDGLLDVYTQEYPRLYAHTQNTTSHNPNATESVYPQHPSSFLTKSDILKNPELVLAPGVWHYTHHHMSHLNTAFGCNDTWSLLMQIVTQLGRQKRTTNQQHKYTPMTKPDIAKPDMQKVKFSFTHREETSLGVAYRQRNLYFAMAIVLLLWFSGFNILDGLNRPFFGMCAGLLCVAITFVLHPRQADSSAPRRIYLSNKKLLIADVAETVYALYRLVDTFNVVPVVDESTLLCEVVLLSLLPRPLLDHTNPPLSVLASVLLLFVPDIWRSIACTSVSAALMLFTVLPKLCWVVIYCNQWELCASWRVTVRDSCVWGAVALFLCAWLYFLSHLYSLYHCTDCRVDSIAYSLTLVLLAIFPLSKFQDLSMCIQVVLIEQHASLQQ